MEYADQTDLDVSFLEETIQPVLPADETTSDPAEPVVPPVAEQPVTMPGPDLPTYDPAVATPVAGDPEADMALWHQQEADDTCAVVAQEFVLESLTGEDYTEGELAQLAAENGWYKPPTGTPFKHTDSLLEAAGVPTETQYGGTVEDITQSLEEGNKVIVGVDSDEIWNLGLNPRLDEMKGDPIPGQDANHAVEVTGIVETAQGPQVVINDPGHPDGAGRMIPLSEFESAWMDADAYMVTAGPGVDDSIDAHGPGHA
jgi:hypothetical protein